MSSKNRKNSNEDDDDVSVISTSFKKKDKNNSQPSGDIPSISGYLLKKSSSGEWQRRYFETNGTFLTYYKSQKMTKLLAALSLPQVGGIHIKGDIEDNQGKGVIIQLDLKDREYTLRALTVKEAQKWVDVLVALRDLGGEEVNNSSGKGKSSSKSKKNDLRGSGQVEMRETLPNDVKDIGSAPQKKCCGWF
eukprot:TRINITY_DN12773_c0_g1_i2.p1 TRINITY_DN12773_c0_g1~~TRINITY_DN12773_c0_g1_i2.p1  ORF type:complete len:191 (-),score=2.15 TRINITY_DN12773_c0_g1_i2:160-732(-)